MFQGVMPVKLWTECFLTTTYIINRVPSELLQNQSPYFGLYGKNPDYSHFRTFGFLAYVFTLSANRTKFSPRASACVFLGYPPEIKA